MANGKFSNPRQIPEDNKKQNNAAPESQDETFSFLDEFLTEEYGPEDSPKAETTIQPIAQEPIETAMPKLVLSETGEPLKRRHIPVIIACTLALLLIVGCFLFNTYSKAVDPYGGKILSNTTIAGVDVGGMTEKEARKAVEGAIGSFGKEDLTIFLPGETLRLSAKETGISLNIRGAVNEAFRFGRDGTAEDQQNAFASSRSEGYRIDLTNYIELREDTIRQALNSYASQYTGKYTASGYVLEGERPALNDASLSPEAPCQTLVLHTGTAGFTLDMDEVYAQVVDAICSNCFQVSIDAEQAEMVPEPLDLETIYAEVCTDPVEPSVDRKTGDVIPGSYGYDFDIAAASERLRTAGSGETIEIPMKLIPTTIQGDEVYFQDVLGYCLTPHGDNEKRTENLRLACRTLDGLVIAPGESISYNELLGERTAENGYQPAPAYSGTRLIDSIGGGICQVSSTLYLASLFAELETVDRVNHGFPVAYIPIGLDATVSWGSPDLKIKNSSNLPVKILAEEVDGFVKVWIMGTETRDYYVKMDFNAGGRYAVSYTCKYDRATDALVSTELNRRSAYLTEDLSAKGTIGSGEAYINGLVRVPDVPDTYAGGNKENT